MTQDRIGGNGHEMPLFSDYFHYLLGVTYQRVMLDLKEGVKLAVSLSKKTIDYFQCKISDHR